MTTTPSTTPASPARPPRPELDERVRTTIREQAAAAYRAVGASGFARVDFLVQGGRVYLSEINTIPGFTPISLFPLVAGHRRR